MAVTTTKTNKPINPRGNDQSPKGYNRAALYSGKALDFDGVNDSVQCDNLDTLYTSDFTICYAAKFEQSGDNWVVIQGGTGTNNAIITGRQAGNVIRFAFYNNDLDAPINETPQLNEWCWLAFTYNRTTKARKIYINGILAAEDISSANPNPVANDFQISSYSSLSGYYNNQVSNVKVYSTALTAAQVADLYNNPEKVVPTGVDNTALKLWLPMMEGAGTTAYDGSGNGNHGTISGATYVNGVGAPVSQSAVMDWNKGQNLLKYSEELDRGSYWSTTAAIVTSNDTTAPDGQETADLLKETTTSAPHYINIGVITAASTTYVQSVWVKKKDDGIYAGIRTNGVGGDSYIIFDFDTATIVAAGSDIISNGVEAYSNGWYRIYMTYTLQPTGAIYSVTNSSSSVIPSYTGTGKGYYIWGAQLEASDSLTAYIPNHTETPITSPVLLPQGLTSGRDITGVNLFENVRKQGALNLDGNSWAEVHDNASLDITDAITLECWFYDTDEGAFEGVIGKWKDSTQRTYAIIKNNGSNNFLIRVSTDGSAQVGPIITNTDYGWIHLVLTYDGANVKGYKNGVYQSQAPLTGSIATNDLPVEIGRYGQSTGSQYNNQIAQPRIYNRALTAEEVQRNYDAGKNIYS